jgi:hypothetical protein
MTADNLRTEIEIEFQSMRIILKELSELQRDVHGRSVSVREKAAAAAFMANFYNGIENILKRISRYYRIPVPTGDTWHLDLFQRFCAPAYTPLPEVFDDKTASEIAPYRRFRHVVYHGYAFDLEWDRMSEGIEKAADVFARFESTIHNFIETLIS